MNLTLWELQTFGHHPSKSSASALASEPRAHACVRACVRTCVCVDQLTYSNGERVSLFGQGAIPLLSVSDIGTGNHLHVLLWCWRWGPDPSRSPTRSRGPAARPGRVIKRHCLYPSGQALPSARLKAPEPRGQALYWPGPVLIQADCPLSVKAALAQRPTTQT